MGIDLQFPKFFRFASARHKEREQKMKGWEGKGTVGEGREEGRRGKGTGEGTIEGS
jgi:hypothetical protein